MDSAEIIRLVAASIGSLGVGLLLMHFRARPKLIWYGPVTFSFAVQQGEGAIPINTAGITIQNVGRETAENVEFHFQLEPTYFRLSHNYEATDLPNGTHKITIASLGSKEILNFQILYFDEMPILSAIRFRDGAATQVPVLLARRYPPSLYVISAALTIFGGLTAVYFVVKFISWLSTLAPAP